MLARKLTPNIGKVEAIFESTHGSAMAMRAANSCVKRPRRRNSKSTKKLLFPPADAASFLFLFFGFTEGAS